MARLIRKYLCYPLFLALLVSIPALGQQAPDSSPANNTSGSYPSSAPGVYIQDAAGWHLLTQNTSYKVKVKHGFLSGLTYGAVAAPMIVDYSGAQAAVQIHATRPRICVHHILTPGDTLLVHLHQKKHSRELDSGSLRALPFVGATRQAQADASSLIAATATSNDDCNVLLQPKTDLAPGEYAVMFGAQNVAILDFGVISAP